MLYFTAQKRKVPLLLLRLFLQRRDPFADTLYLSGKRLALRVDLVNPPLQLRRVRFRVLQTLPRRGAVGLHLLAARLDFFYVRKP